MMEKSIEKEINDIVVPDPGRKRIYKKVIILTVLLIMLITGIFAVSFETKNKNETPPHITPTPTPEKDVPFGIYTPPRIPKKETYIIFMVGDSMTEILGEFGGQINETLNRLYNSTPGHQHIVIDNYATGSTNLLGLQEAMKVKKVNTDTVLDPLLSRKFDLILIESFGYNPLSQLGLVEGLKKQTQTLDEVMKLLTKTHPDALIVFVATIAPNKETYGQELDPNSTLAGRVQEAEERMEYIKNHMAFAKAHNIPLIDIYDKSLTPSGDGDLTYINPQDHIHPSFKGVDFISNEIAHYIFDNQLLPL